MKLVKRGSHSFRRRTIPCRQQPGSNVNTSLDSPLKINRNNILGINIGYERKGVVWCFFPDSFHTPLQRVQLIHHNGINHD